MALGVWSLAGLAGFIMGYHDAKSTLNQKSGVVIGQLQKDITETRAKLDQEYRKGLAKGREAGILQGRTEARAEMQQDFVEFLEGQLAVLKKSLPAPNTKREDEGEIFVIE